MTAKKKATITKGQFYKMLKSGEFAEMVRETVKYRQMVSNGDELLNIMQPLVAKEPDVEQFWVLYLDSSNAVLEISKMFTGSLTSTAVHPREVVKKVIELKASAIICCHNHPSGEVRPSEQDFRVTMLLLVALRSIEGILHEHLIIGTTGKYYSMADNSDIHAMNLALNNFLSPKNIT